MKQSPNSSWLQKTHSWPTASTRVRTQGLHWTVLCYPALVSALRSDAIAPQQAVYRRWRPYGLRLGLIGPASCTLLLHDEADGVVPIEARGVVKGRAKHLEGYRSYIGLVVAVLHCISIAQQRRHLGFN